MQSHVRTLAALGAFLALPVSAFAAQAKPKAKAEAPAIDPNAQAELQQMSNYLAGLRSFTFNAKTMDEAVTTEGEKVQYLSEQKVAVQRPNRMLVERKDANTDVQVTFDGQNLTVFGKNTGFYATAPAAGQLDAAIDQVRQRLNIEAPGADLLVSNPYSVLADGITSAKYLGVEPIDGTPCHHLAFRRDDVDYQLWVQDGAQPVPRRYAIVDKLQKSAPEYVATLSNWNTSAPLTDDLFTFQPPPGAKKIDIRPPSAPVPNR